MLPKGLSLLRFASPTWAFGNGFSLGIIPALITAAASMYAANKASKDAKAAANQLGQNAPQPINIGQSMADYLGTITNPQLQSMILGAEGTFRPQYQALNQRDLQNAMLGVAGPDGYFGTLDLQSMAADRAAELNQRLQAQNTEFQLAQLQAMGPQAAQAYLAANPSFAQSLNEAQALGGRQMSGFLNAAGQQALQAPMQSNITPATITAQGMGGYQPVSADQVRLGGVLTPERIAAERVAAGQVQAGQVGGGALGQSLYQQALQAQQLSPLSQALQAQGLGMAQAPGQLTPQEIRAATQGSREQFAQTGRLQDNASIAAEALARSGAARERTYQDLAAAQGINAQLLGAQQAGQALATDVLRTDIGRQQFNVGTGLQAGQFNVGTSLQAQQANQDAALRAALANQQYDFAGQQFNITNAQDVQRMNQAANLQASLANQGAYQNAFQFGAGQDLQAQLANAQLGMQGQLANRDFNAQQQQLRFGNLLQQTGMEQSMLGADRGYALGLMGATQNITPQALNMIGFGQNAAAIPIGASFLGTAQQQAGMQGPQLFNPDVGINLALAQQANQAGYGAAMAGAGASLAGARIGAQGQLYGQGIQGLGGALGNVNWGSIFGGSRYPTAGTPGTTVAPIV